MEKEPLNLKPRSCIFNILKIVNKYVQKLLYFEIQSAKKFLSIIVNTVVLETKQHCQYFKLIEAKNVRMLNVFEFEFLIWFLDPKQECQKKEVYTRVKEIFDEVNQYQIDGQPFIQYLKKKIRTWKLKNNHVFNFSHILVD